MKSFLIIQTAFIGDVILATTLIENIYCHFPESRIDFLLRKGNESLLKDHPKLNQVIIWDKKQGKYKNLFRIIRTIRGNKYNYVINVQRFATSGIITLLSKGNTKIGFRKNPFSFTFHHRINHQIKDGVHEVDRNLKLIEPFIGSKSFEKRPVLYPSTSDFSFVEKYSKSAFVCMAPASVWFTKQLPKEKWIELINSIDKSFIIYFIGAPNDSAIVSEIMDKSQHNNMINLCGKLSLLQSAALMKNAVMNYVNDSAPQHLASAVNAPQTAFFCSTVPKFGFGPLSTKSIIAEIEEDLECRPCGLHGKKKCPKEHFNCAFKIDMKKIAV